MAEPRARTIADIRRELEAAEQRFEALIARWREIGTTHVVPEGGPSREWLDHVEEHLAETRFDLMWHRHTGTWWRLHSTVTLDEDSSLENGTASASETDSTPGTAERLAVIERYSGRARSVV